MIVMIIFVLFYYIITSYYIVHNHTFSNHFLRFYSFFSWLNTLNDSTTTYSTAINVNLVYVESCYKNEMYIKHKSDLYHVLHQ